MENDKIVSLYQSEWKELRCEMDKLKECQISYMKHSITFTSTITAAYLGIIRLVVFDETNSFWLFFFSPLIIIIPGWSIFFDKFISLQRIIGYTKFIEELLAVHLNQGLKIKYIGWQSARSIIHDYYKEYGSRFYEEHFFKLSKPIKENTKKTNFIFKILKASIDNIIQPIIMRILLVCETFYKIIFNPIQTRSNRYWIYCYFVFLSLAIICMITSLYFAPIETSTLEPAKYSLEHLMFKLNLYNKPFHIRLIWVLVFVNVILASIWNLYVLGKATFGHSTSQNVLNRFRKILKTLIQAPGENCHLDGIYLCSKCGARIVVKSDELFPLCPCCDHNEKVHTASHASWSLIE